jgi:hypothetical protein
MRASFAAFMLEIAAVVAAMSAASLTLGACSSKQGADATTGANVAPQGTDTNPDGLAYPTQHYGRRARGLGAGGKANTTPGDVMPNLTFLGYPDGDPSKPMQPVSLASYYDPDSARYKLLHVIYSDGWCPDCQDEIAALTKALQDPSVDYRKRGVVYLEAIGEGAAQNAPATKSDLDLWIGSHPKLFAEVLDPEARALGAFFDTSTVPFNADIDPRSMEILSSGTGYSDPASVKVWIDWVETFPPMVP